MNHSRVRTQRGTSFSGTSLCFIRKDCCCCCCWQAAEPLRRTSANSTKRDRVRSQRTETKVWTSSKKDRDRRWIVEELRTNMKFRMHRVQWISTRTILVTATAAAAAVITAENVRKATRWWENSRSQDGDTLVEIFYTRAKCGQVFFLESRSFRDGNRRFETNECVCVRGEKIREVRCVVDEPGSEEIVN